MIGRFTPTEHQHQVNLFQWAKAQSGKYPELKLMFAVPNAAKRNLNTAMYMKAEGLASGVPDIFLPCARGAYHGLFIELKRAKGSVVSKTQKVYLDGLNMQGYKAVVCYGFDEAKNVILGYLKQEN